MDPAVRRVVTAHQRGAELEAWMVEYVNRGWEIPHSFVRQWLMARFGQN